MMIILTKNNNPLPFLSVLFTDLAELGEMVKILKVELEVYDLLYEKNNLNFSSLFHTF